MADDSPPTYDLGQRVKILDGPFKGYAGTVRTFDEDRRQVHVEVDFFVHDHVIRLDVLQVVKHS